MAYNSKYARSTQFIDFDRLNKDKVKEDKPKSEDAFLRKKVNGWSFNMEANQDGRIIMSAIKTVGRLRGVGTTSGLVGQGDPSEASIYLKVETTMNRIPNLKGVIDRSHHSQIEDHSTKWVEIDDRQNRTTQDFEHEDEFYKREHALGSVLTIDEFFIETVPGFEKLLNDKKLDEYVSEISKQASKVQKPHTRNYEIVN